MFRRIQYKYKVRRLLNASRELARSLESQAPTDHSQHYFSGKANSLHALQKAIRGKINEGATRDDLLYEIQDLKELLSRIGAATAKDEIPIARPDLLDEALELISTFQESKYRGL